MNETISEKYSRLRPLFKDGDLILFHGNGIVAKIIQTCDKSYFNHVGIIIEKLGALYIVDSNESGVQADRLSWRIKKYSKNGNFSVIQSTTSQQNIETHLSELLRRSDEKWIKYDFINGIKELANRKFSWSLKINTSDNEDICSDFVSEYAKNLEMVYVEQFNQLRIAFPEDFIRYREQNKTILLN